MPVQTRDFGKMALAHRHAPHLIRLRVPETGEYLHMSGTGRTRNRHYAWLGLPRQARILRDRAHVRGEPWPYEGEQGGQVLPVRRDGE
ncbi:MAG: hypothetical protein ACPG61_18975 [Paracoccaceae bacterium]